MLLLITLLDMFGGVSERTFGVTKLLYFRFRLRDLFSEAVKLRP